MHWRHGFRFQLALSIATALAATGATDERPPNIVLLVADDLGYGDLGCYGQSIIQTPRLDRLASEGMRFTQHYAGAPVCAPSRCVLMTGRHSGHAAIRDNSEHTSEGQLPLPAGTVTLAELLRQAGYATAAIGKWGLGYPGSTGDPQRQGFERFFGYNCQRHAHNHFPRYLWRNDQRVELPNVRGGSDDAVYSQDLFIAEALSFIRGTADRPFFLYLPFTIPHLSIQVPESSLSQYLGQVTESDYAHRDAYVKHPAPHAGYAAMISHLDRGIGQVLDLLEQLGLAENTLVIFTSDNGPTYGRLGGADSDFFTSAGPLRGRKGSVYEGGIRVPLIVRWPGKVPAGRVSEHVCAFWDLLPTITAATGGMSPADLDGVSFLPTLLDQGAQPRHDYLVWHFPGYGGQQAVRKGAWKMVRRDLLRREKQPPELYDLSVDLAESRDLAAAQPKVVAELLQILRETQRPSEHFPVLP